ncbi:MAG: hypothetical protein M1321_03000 [Candidatus Marsarchaeota archaeon]|nr:hypothetical protein [Candidatus Marsarchaeota archaeon]
MGILDIFGKKDVSNELGKKVPFMIRTEFTPYHLKSRERSTVTLNLGVKNITGEPVLSSAVVELPRQLSFDSIGVSKQKEVRLGTMAKDEEKTASVDIFGGTGTDKGTYTLTITAFIHYRDYGHIINEVRKRVAVEAV